MRWPLGQGLAAVNITLPHCGLPIRYPKTPSGDESEGHGPAVFILILRLLQRRQGGSQNGASEQNPKRADTEIEYGDGRQPSNDHGIHGDQNLPP